MNSFEYNFNFISFPIKTMTLNPITVESKLISNQSVSAPFGSQSVAMRQLLSREAIGSLR